MRGGIARAYELHAAVGQVDSNSGEGGTPGLDSERGYRVGGESECAAERGVYAEGDGFFADAGGSSEGGWE